jgi:hypothetical protein
MEWIIVILVVLCGLMDKSSSQPAERIYEDEFDFIKDTFRPR